MGCRGISTSVRLKHLNVLYVTKSQIILLNVINPCQLGFMEKAFMFNSSVFIMNSINMGCCSEDYGLQPLMAIYGYGLLTESFVIMPVISGVA